MRVMGRVVEYPRAWHWFSVSWYVRIWVGMPGHRSKRAWVGHLSLPSSGLCAGLYRLARRLLVAGHGLAYGMLSRLHVGCSGGHVVGLLGITWLRGAYAGDAGMAWRALCWPVPGSGGLALCGHDKARLGGCLAGSGLGGVMSAGTAEPAPVTLAGTSR